jgi:uncharacterized membrane protein
MRRMDSARWTTIARLAVLGVVVGFALDRAGWRPGVYVFGAGILVLLVSVRQP